MTDTQSIEREFLTNHGPTRRFVEGRGTASGEEVPTARILCGGGAVAVRGLRGVRGAALKRPDVHRRRLRLVRKGFNDEK